MTSQRLEDAIFDQNIDLVLQILNSHEALSQDELNTALANATEIDEGCHEAILPLLSHGAQITSQAVKGAAQHKDIDIFQTFLDHGWDINTLLTGVTPIMRHGVPLIRAFADNKKILKWFLEKGADPNMQSNIPKGPRVVQEVKRVDVSLLASASWHDNEDTIEILELLLSYGAELDPGALFKAMLPESGGMPIMKFLIDRGIDLNGRDSSTGTRKYRAYGTPLHYAVGLGSREMAELLLENGADYTIKDGWGKTPAEMANEQGKLDLFELLSK